MADLKTTYKNDVLNTDVNTKRKYTMTTNSDGTVSLTDATTYNIVGDTYGAVEINETNMKINGMACNLVTTPYAEETKTENGVTWTVNTDGTVTANGTATDTTTFILKSADNFTLPAGNYVLSNDAFISSTTRIQINDVNGNALYGTGAAKAVNITLAANTQVTVCIRIESGDTVDNVVFKPMLEIGSTAHDFVTPTKTLAENVNDCLKKVAAAAAGVANHTQAASTINAGTFGGEVVAMGTTNYTTANVKNIVILTDDIGDGTAVTYPEGTIIFCE